MKKCFVLLMLVCVSLWSWGQRSPQHPMDIPEGSTNLYEILEAWEPGTAPAGANEFDDEFYISRVRPLKRIADGDYQVNSSVDANRKLCMWVPLDDPTVKWKALPRYCFEGDNFSMWSYVDIHGNWTAPWMRVSAGITDVAHKNGVKVGCVLSIPYAATVSNSPWGSDYNKLFYRLLEKNNDGSFKYSTKLVKLMKYYGIDGLGCNSEFRSNSAFMNLLMDFSHECHVKAKEIDWEFQLHWYDGTDDSGMISFDRGLGSHNERMFGASDHIVTDMMFANYNWSSNMLSNSVAKAEQLGRSSYDYYAGFDIQGRAFKNGNWQALADNAISIGLWGAHAQSLLHQSSTDDGTSDIAIQKAYLQKQELAFSGGNRNPGLNPAIRADATLSNADLKTFHGLSALLSAKSTIQQVPFVSRFSLGNGLFFNDKGKTTFNHKWYNLNTQDFLPTWRWWITDRTDAVTNGNLAGLIKADFTFDDAWFGGSCVKIHGQTDFSRVKLFKTKLDVQPGFTLSVTYKLLNGTAPKAKVFIAKNSNVSQYAEVALPEAGKKGEWITHQLELSELGITSGDVISMLGLTFEGTTEDYEFLLGEMAVRNPSQSFATVAPTIRKVDVLRGRYNELDFKMYYQSKAELGDQKTYNDEVGTWYFEIYMQQEGCEQRLLTATTSWAAYVIDAPLAEGQSRNVRFGVRAVSPDGNAGSVISWSDYEAMPYNDPLETVIADKPVIKPAEEFTLKFEDTMHAPAQKWEIKDPLTGEVLASAANAMAVTTSIAKEGLYDLYLTNDKGEVIITRGFVQITPTETGAVPAILTFGADKQVADVNEQVTYSYTSKDGEGTVSRALRINDPNMFRVPAGAQTGYAYSYAVWFKVEKYSHDKQGTNLINKNSIADSWPHNNWGDLWVTIRPEWRGNSLHPANEISFNTLGWTAHDSPNEPMMSSGFSVTPGVWNHVVVTQDAAKNQKMYFNGKKVAETYFSASSRREDYSDSRINSAVPADIYFGGGGVYKAGFNGWIDEVQVWNKVLSDTEVVECMKGYDIAPNGLMAYYTFEEINASNGFDNKGVGGSLKGELVKMDGSGGESTGSASYVSVDPDNNVLGYPGITGSLQIETHADWSGLAGAAIPTDADAGKELIVTYGQSGTYDAGLLIFNRWGASEMLELDYVTINVPTNIKNGGVCDEVSAYPNPFVESLNVKVTKRGNYKLRLLNQSGQLVVEKDLIIDSDSEIVNVQLNSNLTKGIYMLQVMKNNQVYSVLKLIKK